jgi:hypothetical protein
MKMKKVDAIVQAITNADIVEVDGESIKADNMAVEYEDKNFLWSGL